MATKTPEGTRIEQQDDGSWVAYGPDGKPNGRHLDEASAVRAAEQAVGINPGPSEAQIEAIRLSHERRVRDALPGYQIDQRTTRMRISG